MKIINLTGHLVQIETKINGEKVVIPLQPDGPEIRVDLNRTSTCIEGLLVEDIREGNIGDLPPFEEGTIIIASSLSTEYANKKLGRLDVMAPATGRRMSYKDKNGNLVVKSLRRFLE